jgi:hypothetical protein
VLVEQLHVATAAFDRCRAVRNAQRLAEDMRMQQRRATNYKAVRSAVCVRARGGWLLCMCMHARVLACCACACL